MFAPDDRSNSRIQQSYPGNPPPTDPLDAADYDPLQHLNLLFAHPSTLPAVPATSKALLRHLENLDTEITQLVVAQSATNADSLSRISAAKKDLAALFKNIDAVRERAIRTEEAITAMTRDIKKLDSTKRNLTVSMTVLKRLQMLTTAYEQLKSLSKTRQYRECASLLSAVLELMAHFKSYRSIDQIATLSRNVADLKAELLDQVCEDFETVFIKGDIASHKSTLSEACAVLDALGNGARARLVNWYCNTQLREYRTVFRNNDEAGSLDNIARRYAWLKRLLKTYDEEHAGILPGHWKVGEVVARTFCDGTREDFKGILAKSMRKEGGRSLDVNLLLGCLQETLEFEGYLERKFSSERMSIDTNSSRDDRPLIFGKAISEAFEPYLSVWVESQDKHLSTLLPTYRNAPLQPPDEELTPTSVLPSSIDLFTVYRQTLSQCAKLSTGTNLLELSKSFAKHLDEYATSILTPYLSPDTSNKPLEAIETICILNTADYCHTTTAQLEDRIRTRIDPEFANKIDFEREKDEFITVINTAIRALVNKVENSLDPIWREMRNVPWSRLDTVGDQSGYVAEFIKVIRTSVTEVLTILSKDVWRRAFCDRVVEAVVSAWAGCLVGCRPIGGVGAEQMLLDCYAVKKAFDDLPSLGGREETSVAGAYTKHLTRTMSKLDALLKTLQVSTTPSDALVQAYLIHISDRSESNFRKVLELKGIRKPDQGVYVEQFWRQVESAEGLVECSGFVAGLNLVEGGKKEERRFENGFGGILAKARDGVERMGEEVGEGGVRGLGGLFFRREREREREAGRG
ncbi:Vacuolar protein sorting-associated protein 53 [Rhizina undulata]